MKDFVEKHPLTTVLALAVILRLVAVIVSKGYMASDDQYETVDVAYRWLRGGMFNTQGFLVWSPHSSGNISRFPLYTLLLYLNIKIVFALGYQELDSIMYGVRLTHALFSLLGVWGVYKLVELITGSGKWAMTAGLIMAAHFTMPFLAVRNLIEMFGGTLWILSLLYLYRHGRDDRPGLLIIAGVLSGLAWMFRFQMIFAFWVIPVVLLYEKRRLAPAFQYGLTVVAMFLLAGLADWYLTGTFMGTSLNHIRQGLSEGSLYSTNYLIYPAVLLMFFIPPLSLLALFAALRKRFFSKHLLLTASTFAFILLHSIAGNRQERFMIPIVPALVVVFVIAFYHYYHDNGFLLRWKKTIVGIVALALIVNVVLLVPFTFNYGHKGLVEPMVRIQRLTDTQPVVLFVTPEKQRIFPLLYSGLEPARRRYLMTWANLDRRFHPDSAVNAYDFYLLYPNNDDDLGAYKDSIISRAGPIEEVFHVGPSTIDYILHALNPGHNPTNEVWVYRDAR